MKSNKLRLEDFEVIFSDETYLDLFNFKWEVYHPPEHVLSDGSLDLILFEEIWNDGYYDGRVISDPKSKYR